MNKSILILSLIALFISPIGKADCLDAPLEITLQEMRYREPTIFVNGSLRIYLGDKEGQVVDIFSKRNEPFDGLEISRETRESVDPRNWVMRQLFPKELAPPKHYLNVSLSSYARKDIQGRQVVTLNLSVQVGNQRQLIRFFVSPDLSNNCRPQPLPSIKSPVKKSS